MLPIIEVSKSDTKIEMIRKTKPTKITAYK